MVAPMNVLQVKQKKIFYKNLKDVGMVEANKVNKQGKNCIR